MEKSLRLLLDCQNTLLDKKEAGITCSPSELVVINVLNLQGLVENGSFQYFFECELNADDWTTDDIIKSLTTLGEIEAAEIVIAAKGLFPNGQPQDDFDERLLYMQEREESFDDLASRLMDIGKQIEGKLTEFARAQGLMARAA